MKIAILNSIIDTENIYEIEPISCYNIHGNNDSMYFHRTEELLKNANYIGFIIKLYNDKEIDCYLPIYNICHTNIEERQIIWDKVNDLRTRIAETWAQNQSQIPKFNFE